MRKLVMVSNWPWRRNARLQRAARLSKTLYRTTDRAAEPCRAADSDKLTMGLAAQGHRDSVARPNVLGRPPLIGGRIIHLGKVDMT